MKLCKEDLQVNIFKSIEGIFDVYGQSKDMADFHNLQGTLEARTLEILLAWYLLKEIWQTICESADSMPVKLNQLPSVRSDFHKTL